MRAWEDVVGLNTQKYTTKGMNLLKVLVWLLVVYTIPKGSLVEVTKQRFLDKANIIAALMWSAVNY